MRWLWKKKRRLAVAFLCILLTLHIGRLIYDAGTFKTLREIGVEQCRRIEMADGPEDFAYDRNEQVVIISSLNRYSDAAGGLYLFDTVTEAVTRVATDVVLYPHGISLFQDNSGRSTLFVISHPPDGSVVHLFDWSNRNAKLRKTIDFANHQNPNDLAAVSHDSFYTTHDHSSRNSLGKTLEDYGRLAMGYVTLFDGNQFSIVANRLSFPNGIVFDERKYLYISEMLNRSVVQFEPSKKNTLSKRKTYYIGSGPDNLTLDERGFIVVANHPQLLKLSKYRRDPSRGSPSEVVVIDPESGHQRLVFQHRGGLIAASSVALRIYDECGGERLIIGSVFDSAIAIRRKSDSTDGSKQRY